MPGVRLRLVNRFVRAVVGAVKSSTVNNTTMNNTNQQQTNESKLNDVVTLLNSAFAADPAAINALMSNRVPCNDALADHPTVLVEKQPVAGDHYAVGALGLINAVVETLIGHRVATSWTKGTDAAGAHEMLGFTKYLLPEKRADILGDMKRTLEDDLLQQRAEIMVKLWLSEPNPAMRIQAMDSVRQCNPKLYTIAKERLRQMSPKATDLSEVKTAGDSIVQSLLKRCDPESATATPPGVEPVKDKNPLAGTDLEATFNCCLHLAEQLEFNMLITDPDVIWYGPHECNGCGKQIVKSSIDTGGVALDFAHNSHYPNHVWEKHVCAGGAPKSAVK